jgi:TldD protein
LDNFDEGELFVEEVYSENIFFDDNKIKNASYDQDKGFGLRTVNNDSVNFAHNTELSDEAFFKSNEVSKRTTKIKPQST